MPLSHTNNGGEYIRVLRCDRAYFGVVEVYRECGPVRRVPRGRARGPWMPLRHTCCVLHRLDGSVTTFLKLDFTKIAVIGYKEW